MGLAEMLCNILHLISDCGIIISKVSVTALCIGNAQAVAVFLKITAEAFNLWLLRI